MTFSGRKEALVIGAGLGGLSAAIHLRLAGWRVRVLEAGASAGGRANRISVAGLPFDTGPTLLNYPWVFEELFRAAGRDMGDYVRLLKVDPSITYHWPDGQHLTLSSDRERLRAEFERFAPGSSRGLDLFLEDCAAKFEITFRKLVLRNDGNPLRYFSVLTAGEILRTALWRSMYRELGRFFSSPRLCEALGSYAMYLGGSPFELPGLFTILPYGELSGGLWLPEGGIYALVQAVERLARELGVEIHYHSRAQRILHRNGRVTGVRLADGSEIASSVVVSNVDVPSTLTELAGLAAPKIRMSPSVMTFYWAVAGRQPGLGHHTIFFPRDYAAAFRDLNQGCTIPADPAFYVAAPGVSDPTLADDGRLGVFVLVPVPLLSRLGKVDWAAETDRVRETVLRRLSAAGASLSAQAIAGETVWTPETWSRRFGLFQGSAFGAAHTLSQMGPFRPPNFSRRLRGLYFTGASTTPGTGMPMVVLSGRLTAERIQQHAR
ncbi:MAG: phytoene desaturase [Bryobacteraceae bacterium]|nr:MAG: phytoene desaturase [Bryobacteraceae bacterium]